MANVARDSALRWSQPKSMKMDYELRSGDESLGC
jgi:hypothetical protein